MVCKQIRAIIVFKDSNHKSMVDFKNGVNIIQGDSKTGKSALVEIIDYCLCSNRCTIPKGVITDYANLYVIVLDVGVNRLLIARKKDQDGGKMCIVIVEKTFDINNIKIEMFDDFISHKEVQLIIEDHLGLKVVNMGKSFVEQNTEKASLRNMVSYMFQHQNMIANKFAIFYRFTDSKKKQQVIDQFPIFAGIVDQKYYSDMIDLKRKEAELKLLEKKQLQTKIAMEEIKKDFLPLIKDYYALNNQSVPENINTYSMDKLISFAKKLPIIEVTFLSDEIVDRYSALKKEILDLKDRETDVHLKLKNLINTDNVKDEYIDVLEQAQKNFDLSKTSSNVYMCPLCGKEDERIKKAELQINDANNWVKEEISYVSKYDKNFIEDKRKLNELLGNIKSELKSKNDELSYIEKKYVKNGELKDKQEKIINSKIRIDFYIQTFEGGLYNDLDSQLDELKQEIKEIKSKIKQYDIESCKKEASEKIDRCMNRLAATLDFEEEYKPLNLHFDLDSFDLYHYDNKKDTKIYLEEMGSGANWLSCHIALFLSFIRYFTEQKEKSPMPLFLFFDQPSQVYFPNTVDTKKQNDILAISRIYKTIFDEINSIYLDTGIEPQLIIVEHVKGDVLKEIGEAYSGHTFREWDDTNKFIQLPQ